MGRPFSINLEGNIYSCKYCHTHLALKSDIISTSFHCKHGLAYLFDKCVNVSEGDSYRMMMITGLHIIVDTFCVGCGSNVGWKYEGAFDKEQAYKDGRYVLARYKVLGPDGSNYSESRCSD